jgi:hypothetical protein
MALETGTYISDLVATNPLSSDPKSQGDDHLRLIKKTIKNTFPNVAGEVSATHTALNAANKGRNKIINGDFLVWQRGTSFAAIASSAYAADRWFYGNTTSSAHTVSRSTDVPTVTEAGRLFNYSLLIDCITADTSIATGENIRFAQRIEGYNFAPLAQRSFTLSFWVKATKTGIYCVHFINSGTDRSYIAEYTVNTTDTWEYKTITVSASPTAGTWDYTTGIGLDFGFCLGTGATFQTTADAWRTGNFRATANQVNACDSTSNKFRITGIQIEPGVDATEFEHKLFSETLVDCRRYYELIGNTATSIFSGNVTSGSDYYVGTRFSVTKRATPTIVATNGAAGRFPTTSGTIGANSPEGFLESRVANSTGEGLFWSIYTASAEL